MMIDLKVVASFVAGFFALAIFCWVWERLPRRIIAAFILALLALLFLAFPVWCLARLHGILDRWRLAAGERISRLMQ